MKCGGVKGGGRGVSPLSFICAKWDSRLTRAADREYRASSSGGRGDDRWVLSMVNALSLDRLQSKSTRTESASRSKLEAMVVPVDRFMMG